MVNLENLEPWTIINCIVFLSFVLSNSSVSARNLRRRQPLMLLPCFCTCIVQLYARMNLSTLIVNTPKARPRQQVARILQSQSIVIVYNTLQIVCSLLCVQPPPSEGRNVGLGLRLGLSTQRYFRNNLARGRGCVVFPMYSRNKNHTAPATC